MKKIIGFPLHLVWQAIVLPIKVMIASLGFTFRAGVSVGKLPVRGGAIVTRALGWKIVGALSLGMVLGFLVGRQIGLLSHNHDHDEPTFDVETSTEAEVAA
ncbi:MAG: hypothetical protein WCJ88_08015 [Actinomycetes bacterium]